MINLEKMINDINNSNLPEDTKKGLLSVLKTVAMNKANEQSKIKSDINFVFEDFEKKKK